MKLPVFQRPVNPTTGILAVFVALNYCDVVHIVGFGYPNSSQRQPIHYYGYDTMTSMKVGSVSFHPRARCKSAGLTLSVFSAAEL